MIDGTPDAVKVACPVWSGGKSGDYFKGLPITISRDRFGLRPDAISHERSAPGGAKLRDDDADDGVRPGAGGGRTVPQPAGYAL